MRVCMSACTLPCAAVVAFATQQGLAAPRHRAWRHGWSPDPSVMTFLSTPPSGVMFSQSSGGDMAGGSVSLASAAVSAGTGAAAASAAPAAVDAPVQIGSSTSVTFSMVHEAMLCKVRTSKLRDLRSVCLSIYEYDLFTRSNCH